MSTLGPAHRSFLPITLPDLQRLRAIAAQDRATFFAKHPDWAAHYADRVLLVALCQGAARHYLDGTTGVQDFDVYTFFAENPARRWCARRRAIYDFGDPKFGQSSDKPQFVGRRVDVLARAVPWTPGQDAGDALQAYLRTGRTETARRLAEQAVVILEPVGRMGKALWP